MIIPDYLHGHFFKGRKREKPAWNKGLKHSPETIEKIKAVLKAQQRTPWNKGKKRPPFSEEWKRKLSLNNPSHKPEVREKRRQQLLNGHSALMNASPRNPEKMESLKNKLSEWMKNGHAVYMNEFIKNPSRPQLEIFNMVKDIYPSAILNYSFKSNGGEHFSIDVMIPEMKIAIEYDGSHWHKDHAKDLRRQSECEKSGLKFIRYMDYVPPKSEIIESIRRIAL